MNKINQHQGNSDINHQEFVSGENKESTLFSRKVDSREAETKNLLSRVKFVLKSIRSIEKNNFHPSWKYNISAKQNIIFEIQSLLAKKDYDSLIQNLPKAEVLLQLLYQNYNHIKENAPGLAQKYIKEQEELNQELRKSLEESCKTDEKK